MSALSFDNLFPELKYLIGRHLDTGSKFALSLVSQVNHATFKVVPYDPNTFSLACCTEGFLPLLQWGRSQHCPVDSMRGSLFAAKGKHDKYSPFHFLAAGHMEVLEWLYESDYAIDFPALSEFAATVRSRELLAWLESKRRYIHIYYRFDILFCSVFITHKRPWASPPAAMTHI